MDLFDDYHYWVIGKNLPKEEYTPYEVIKFHQKCGGMEKRIGELKHSDKFGPFALRTIQCQCFVFHNRTYGI